MTGQFSLHSTVDEEFSSASARMGKSMPSAARKKHYENAQFSYLYIP